MSQIGFRLTGQLRGKHWTYDQGAESLGHYKRLRDRQVHGGSNRWRYEKRSRRTAKFCRSFGKYGVRAEITRCDRETSRGNMPGTAKQRRDLAIVLEPGNAVTVRRH